MTQTYDYKSSTYRSKRDLRTAIQGDLLFAMTAAVSYMDDVAAVREEAHRQIARAAKLFGWTGWPSHELSR